MSAGRLDRLHFNRLFNSALIPIAIVAVFTVGKAQLVKADDYDPAKFNPSQFIEYERQLNALLKTRRDEEKLFVGQIVAQIRLGKIPSKLVQTSYQWVRNKRPDTNYPFIYFEKVLRLQAAKLKLEGEVPRFDYSVYLSAGQRASNSSGQRTAESRAADIRSSTGRSAGQKR